MNTTRLFVVFTIDKTKNKACLVYSSILIVIHIIILVFMFFFTPANIMTHVTVIRGITLAPANTSLVQSYSILCQFLYLVNMCTIKHMNTIIFIELSTMFPPMNTDTMIFPPVIVILFLESLLPANGFPIHFHDIILPPAGDKTIQRRSIYPMNNVRNLRETLIIAQGIT